MKWAETVAKARMVQPVCLVPRAQQVPKECLASLATKVIVAMMAPPGLLGQSDQLVNRARKDHAARMDQLVTKVRRALRALQVKPV